ncbi:MAG: polysaccharide biosynthesis/export family protein [Bacteroidetes bacterium]|nr:polysaccharide biosynthesis/export family protein [Bacteroidota bacterium]
MNTTISLQSNRNLFQIMLFLGFISFALSSCYTAKKYTYFQDITKDTTLQNVVLAKAEPTIRTGDLLTIAVASLSPENTALYNAPQTTEGTTSGYMVNEEGDIPFVKLGMVHALGLTRTELKAKLEKSLEPFLAQPIVSIGFANRHVTMLGAISPQIIPMPNKNMTLLDALATSGDIGTKGKSNDVLVIREKEGAKEFKRLNLTDKSIFYSPYFYLQPNDIVYVEPLPERKASKLPQILSYITTGITLFIFILDRIIK